MNAWFLSFPHTHTHSLSLFSLLLRYNSVCYLGLLVLGLDWLHPDWQKRHVKWMEIVEGGTDDAWISHFQFFMSLAPRYVFSSWLPSVGPPNSLASTSYRKN